jgi:copper chaperone
MVIVRATEKKPQKLSPAVATGLSGQGKTMDTLKIKGMSCQHCVGAVKKALGKFPELSQIAVDLEAGQATFVNNGVDRQQLRAAISKIGFEPGE